VKKEGIVKLLFKNKYPNNKVYYNYRPEWLINPLTGKRLELDIYYPELNLAIEINGIHHGLNYQKYKDNIKYEVCISKGIKLESVNLKSDELRSLIKRYELDASLIGKRQIRRFGMGTPRKGTIYHGMWKKIKKENYFNHLKDIKGIQEKETEGIRRRKEARQAMTTLANRLGRE
jgi:hypothetical protein